MWLIQTDIAYNQFIENVVKFYRKKSHSRFVQKAKFREPKSLDNFNKF